MRERSVGGTTAVPVPVFRAKTGSLQRTREAAYSDRYGDNLGGLGDDPSGYLPSAQQQRQQQQQQRERRAVVEPGGRVRARPQSATATMDRERERVTSGRSVGPVGAVGRTIETTQRSAGVVVRQRGEPLRGVFGEVEAPSQSFGAAWGAPDPSDMGLT